MSLLFTGIIDAAAQGGATSTITGVVKDEGEGVLPGASVVAASSATGTKFEATTNSTGTFSIPSLSAGLYTITVSLTGFKTSVIKDVRVQLGIPTSLSPVLGVGVLEETITVSGAGAELINTSTPAVTATMSALDVWFRAAQLTDARELYALLTGRVIAVTGQAALAAETDKYVNFGRPT